MTDIDKKSIRNFSTQYHKFNLQLLIYNFDISLGIFLVLILTNDRVFQQRHKLRFITVKIARTLIRKEVNKSSVRFKKSTTHFLRWKCCVLVFVAYLNSKVMVVSFYVQNSRFFALKRNVFEFQY